MLLLIPRRLPLVLSAPVSAVAAFVCRDGIAVIADRASIEGYHADGSVRLVQSRPKLWVSGDTVVAMAGHVGYQQGSEPIDLRPLVQEVLGSPAHPSATASSIADLFDAHAAGIRSHPDAQFVHNPGVTAAAAVVAIVAGPLGPNNGIWVAALTQDGESRAEQLRRSGIILGPDPIPTAAGHLTDDAPQRPMEDVASDFIATVHRHIDAVGLVVSTDFDVAYLRPGPPPESHYRPMPKPEIPFGA